jgi:hypothetical protein
MSHTAFRQSLACVSLLIQRNKSSAALPGTVCSLQGTAVCNASTLIQPNSQKAQLLAGDPTTCVDRVILIIVTSLGEEGQKRGSQHADPAVGVSP